MQKPDYLKNCRGEGLSDDVLECFYDNISYTPFIHVEEELNIPGHHRLLAPKPRKTLFRVPSSEKLVKSSKEPVDPYTLILDNKLDTLRPSLKDVLQLEDPYRMLGTTESFDMTSLHEAFFRSGVLQIMSARSRPHAFASQATISNPANANPGVVDIKVAKVGLLWRKDIKKKKARSPWQEWGAILTSSQLYFFKDVAWVKTLVSQYDHHHKQGNAGIAVIFKPALEDFKPDALMSTDDAVALTDSTYTRHKHAFTFIRHGGLEETFLANSEHDMNDWLARLNYATAFRTSGVRMRGIVGGNYEGQRSRGMMRMESSNSARSVQTPTGEVTIQHGGIDQDLATNIMLARRQIMMERISEANSKIESLQKHLEDLLRNARHLQILAPIQNRTREQLVLAAGRMSAKLKWVRRDIWRLKCHRDILSLDLEEEEKKTHNKRLLIERESEASSRSQGARQDPVVARHDSRNITPSSPQSAQSARFSAHQHANRTEPTLNVEHSVQGTSQSSLPLSVSQSHQSLELPQPDASGKITDTASNVGAQGSPVSHAATHRSSVISMQDRLDQGSLKHIASRLATPDPSVDQGEQDLIKEAGLARPETPRSESDRDRMSGTADYEFGEGRSKVRRSLHRTLRDAHVPHHHRSKKGKDSASSAGLTEDGSSVAESEGLARGTGSFTVHGKKASVITFGSEWHNMSPEERLKMRKQAHGDKQTIEDEDESAADWAAEAQRRLSIASNNTATTAIEPDLDRSVTVTSGGQSNEPTSAEEPTVVESKTDEDDRGKSLPSPKGKGPQRNVVEDSFTTPTEEFASSPPHSPTHMIVSA